MPLRRITCSIVIFCMTAIFFTGCPLLYVDKYSAAKKTLYLYPDKTDLTVNETIQFRIEYFNENLIPDKIFAIPLIENAEIKVLEGTVIPTDMEDVIFIDFVRPDLEDKETETFLPYCNLELKFLKASIYDFRITGTYKPEFYYSLNAGRHIKFTVTE